jgi:hypothetical protein
MVAIEMKMRFEVNAFMFFIYSFLVRMKNVYENV